MDMLVTFMVLLGIIISMPCAVSFSAGLTCDRTKQNPVRNDTSLAIVRCLNCRQCLPGSEPKVPCGKVIGIYEPVGGCRPCPDGTYSPNRDTKACKICQKKNCFKHQRIEGKCERDKHDQSKCLNECENGYRMSERKTACHLMNMTTTTTTTTTTNDGSNIPKATPTMTSINTTKKLVVSQNQANEKSSGLNPGVIAIIAIAAVAVVGIPIAVYCYYCRNQKRANIGGKKDGDGSASTDVLMDTPEKTGHFSPVSSLVEIPDEETVEQANGPLSPVPPCPKTMAESDNTMSPGTSNPSVSCISNDKNMAKFTPPSRNDQMAFDTPVYSPLPASSGNSREQFASPIIPTPYPYLPEVSRNSNENRPKRLDGNIPYKIIRMICDHFDSEDNWENLAAWLKLSAQEVKRIKNKSFKSKTEQIIQIWSTKAENDLEEFLQILKINGITQLVAEINEEMAACRQEYIC